MKRRTTEDRIEEVIGDTGWRMSDTRAGSAKFGPCEVCGQHADTTYLQTSYHRVAVSEADRIAIGMPASKSYFWTAGSTTFGHRACLLARRNA